MKKFIFIGPLKEREKLISFRWEKGVVVDSEFKLQIVCRFLCVSQVFRETLTEGSAVNAAERTGMVNSLEAIFVTQEIEETGLLACKRENSRG